MMMTSFKIFKNVLKDLTNGLFMKNFFSETKPLLS